MNLLLKRIQAENPNPFKWQGVGQDRIESYTHVFHPRDRSSNLDEASLIIY